jgi:hypothetical protein
MIPLLYVGIISFISSFTVSNIITREYLRVNYEYTHEPFNDRSKKNSLVKFNTSIKVKTIPSIKDISSNTLSELWYNKEEYDVFKKDYILSRKHNSI